MRKLKNEIILTIESKKMSNKERKGKCKAEIITVNEKKWLDHLINCVEELENTSLNK